jgi:hypothetical protein
MEASGVVDGSCLVNFDEGGFLFVIIGVGADVLLAGIVPALDQAHIVIHFQLSN